MGKRQQVTVQEQRPAPLHIPAHEFRENLLELLFRKMALAAATMIGIGYVLVNAPVAMLTVDSILRIPIASQANVMAIAGRVLFLMALAISAVLGVLLIFGAVQFYEHGNVKSVVYFGGVLGAFYLLCLGVGASLLLPEPSPVALALVIGSVFVAASVALYISSSQRWKLVGSAAGVVGGIILAYSISNLKVLDLVFEWNVPFTGPFMSLTLLESAVVILAPVAAMVHAVFGYNHEERRISHAFALLVALTYGLGAFVGSIVLSMSFWNLIWQSSFTGLFHGLSDWVANIIVFWSASLVLMDVGGVLLIGVAGLGFVCMARELSKL
jgi:hypothetical protein